MQGWVKIFRSIQDHWLWDDKPFSKGQAWVDLLLMAGHTDNKILMGNELIELEEGSFITSERKLSDRWGWSRKKVDGFLSLLQKENMVVIKKNHQRTAINIVNYRVFQNIDNKKEPQKSHEGTTKEPPKHINKNVKNDKNNNYIYNVERNESEDKSKDAEYQYKAIVDYLNEKTGKKFEDKSKDTRKHIKARINEGRTFDDFKHVIDVKCAEWKGTSMSQYLRPSTLFGSKFESYLNQEPVPQNGEDKPAWKKNVKDLNNFASRRYDMDDLERQLLDRR